MDESQNGSAFSFGSVEETFYENLNEEIEIGKLPYNPFLFDLHLVLIKSSEGYQQEGLEIELNNTATNVFGRRIKKQNEQQKLAKSLVIRHDFIAQTMSKQHFSIDQNHILTDLQSKKGTYIWIHRSSPKLLQVNDEFLLNQLLIKINSISETTQKIEIQVSQTKTLTLNPKLFKQRLFLIGSSSKCHFVNPTLQPFHVGVDLLGMTIHNMIEDEDCEREKGTWMRVKEGVKVEGGDIVLVYPYVFAIRC